MLFKDVINQYDVKSRLLHMWEQSEFPHAILITGNEGWGGLPMGLALAQYIFCQNKQKDGACGNCLNCNKTAKLEHADLHVSFPSIPPKSGTKAMSRYYIKEFREFIRESPYGTTYDWLQFINAENKQGNITAEECNEIIDTLNLRSYEGGSKVQLIWRPEYLGKEGNKLLKVFEEPPGNTFFILIAENPESILPTILSRMQLVRLMPINRSNIAEALITRLNTDPVKAAQVAQMAMGNYTEAMRLVQHADANLVEEAKRLFNAVFRNNGLEISRVVDDWSKTGREQQKNLLHYIIQLIEQSIRVSYLPQESNAVVSEELKFAQNLAKLNISVDTLQKMVTTISDTILYIERNAHSKTQLHAMIIRLQYLIRGRQLAEH